MKGTRLSDAERQARRRARAYEAGLCGRCFTARRVKGRKSCGACYVESVERIRATGLRGQCALEKARDEKRAISPSFAEQKRATRPATPSRSEADDEIEALLSARPDFAGRLRRSFERDDDEPEVNAEGARLDLYGVPMVRAPRDPRCVRSQNSWGCSCMSCTGQMPEWVRDLPPIVPLVAEKPPKRVPFPFEGDLCVDPFGME